MMPAELEALARRAVACPRWRWMPGMRYLVGSTAGRLTDNQCKGKLPLVAEAMPDLSDPATLGCMLALVREAWDESEIVVVKDCWESLNGWTIGTFREDYNPILHLSTISEGRFGKEHVSIYANSEAETLVAALEAAP